jgi:putative transposase
MPRKARLDAPGILHHLIVRGIERRPIFTHVADRNDFSERCSRLFPENNTCCYAWAFLPNHLHLLLRTGDVPVSTVMARLLSGYATSFNRRHQRSGHLFQNRYKSIICQEDRYFQELVRYIHLNPVRAGLVSDMEGLAEYRWSGHATLLGRRICAWQDAAYTLTSFGSAAAYLEFVQQGFGQGQRNDLIGGGLVRSQGGWAEVRNAQSPIKGDERILGDTSFVMDLLGSAQEKLERRYAIKQSGINLDTVEKRVLKLLSLNRDELYGRGRGARVSHARSLFCFFAAHELGCSQKALADRFSVTEPAITYAVRRGEKIAREHGYSLLEG